MTLIDIEIFEAKGENWRRKKLWKKIKNESENNGEWPGKRCFCGEYDLF
jgi:hypothetical protein